MSPLLGVIAYFGNSKIFKLLKYTNYWEGLFKGTYKKNIANDLIFGYTQADVLVEIDSESRLYSGRVIDYFLSQDTNDLETIILTNVYRYKKINNQEGCSNKVITKPIPGHNFCIDNRRVLNLNLTYVYQKKSQNSFYKSICLFIDLCHITLVLTVFIILFLNTDWVIVATIWKKLIFAFSSLIYLMTIKQIFKNIVNGEYDKINLSHATRLVFFGLPYFWLLGWISGWNLIIFEIIALLIFSIWFANKEKKSKK